MLIDQPPQQPPPSGAAVRWAGTGDEGVLSLQRRRGRRRRWVYVAAGDETWTVGAALVDIGVVGLGTAFAFVSSPAGLLRWDAGPGRAGRVGGLQRTASVQRGGGRVDLTASSLSIDVPVPGGRLEAELSLGEGSPVSLLTPTPRGGWNATTKDAGVPARGRITSPHGEHQLDGGAWTDATDGRQDHHTTWRWAAGSGWSAAGDRRVGLQASTGMNGLGPGEDVVWWDGDPVPLAVTDLTPVRAGAFDGPWRLVGDGWELTLDPVGVRSADEGLGPIRSSYSQPVGTWRGTLPAPDGQPVPVWLAGVAEDHEARW